MSPFTGTIALVRCTLRRDRVRILVWVGAIVALVWISAASTKGLYPTAEDLRLAAATIEDNPAALAFNGPAQALDTIGGRVAFETATFAYLVTALMGIFMVTRLTRAEEEAGRLELLRATVLGRHAPMLTALLVVGGMVAATSVAVTASLLALDLPRAGSVLLGACFLAVGLAFVGIAAVTAQVVENSRVAAGLAGAVLGAAFALRAAGDIGDGTLSWASPLGWAHKARPYAGDRWWPLLLLVALTVGALVLSAALAGRRDAGGGLVPPRPGPAHGSPRSGTPLGLALRLQRAGIGWWALGVGLFGVVFGSVGDDLEDFLGDNQTLQDILVASGVGSLTDAYFGTTLLLLALCAGGFAVQAALRLRSEEANGRAEPLLATPLGRSGWAVSHLLPAFVGSALVVLSGGLGAGVSYAAVSGDPGEVPRLVAASAAHVPAVWVLIGLATALFGLLPRATVAAWAALAWCVLVGFFGELLSLPGWVRALSPFDHTPPVPGGELTVGPLVILLAATAALTRGGLWGFAHRDVG